MTGFKTLKFLTSFHGVPKIQNVDMHVFHTPLIMRESKQLGILNYNTQFGDG